MTDYVIDTNSTTSLVLLEGDTYTLRHGAIHSSITDDWLLDVASSHVDISIEGVMLNYELGNPERSNNLIRVREGADHVSLTIGSSDMVGHVSARDPSNHILVEGDYFT